MEPIYWSILFVLWLVLWRPAMVESWRNRKLSKADREAIRNIKYVEDMFK